MASTSPSSETSTALVDVEPPSGVGKSVVLVQGAAAHLFPRNHDLEPVPVQDPHGRRVHLAEGMRRDAAGEERDPGPLFSRRRRERRKGRGFRSEGRHQSLAFGETGSDPRKDEANEGTKSRAVVDSKEPHEHGKPSRMGENAREQHTLQEPERASFLFLLRDEAASLLHD